MDVNVVVRDNSELHFGDREQREQRILALAWPLADRSDQRPVATVPTGARMATGCTEALRNARNPAASVTGAASQSFSHGICSR